jgi:hypothetical protein
MSHSYTVKHADLELGLTRINLGAMGKDIKVKVKVTLEQATKVQRGITGIALLFP